MKVKPNTDLAFITSVGMSEEDLTWITEMVKERVPFKNIIYKKASAGIASNCGAGTFGILYMDKSERDYNLDTLLYDDMESTYVEAEDDYESSKAGILESLRDFLLTELEEWLKEEMSKLNEVKLEKAGTKSE